MMREQSKGTVNIIFKQDSIDRNLDFFNKRTKTPLEIPDRRLRDFSQIVPVAYLEE